MGVFEKNDFGASVAGLLLQRIAASGAEGGPLDDLHLDHLETGALHELERLGYVQLLRGRGAMAWKIERVRTTEAGRAKLSPSV